MARTIMAPVRGYWLKFAGPSNVALKSLGLTIDTIDVEAGWNMVGSLATPIAAASIQSIPAGIVTSAFIGYNNKYVPTDTINPGQGYWVKVNQAGKLVLSATGSSGAASRIRIVSSRELPPPAPMDGTLLALPQQFALDQNYPNPFNPSTIISYELPAESRVRLTIYNLLGREIVTLVNGNQDAGFKSVEWNASNVASGIYFYRLTVSTATGSNEVFTQLKRMMHLK